MFVFAAIAPHPPILLPTIGGPEDRKKVQKTLEALEKLAEEFAKADPELVIISSPHPDWGIEVPWHFVSSKLKVKNSKLQFKIQNYQETSCVSKEVLERVAGAGLSRRSLPVRLAKEEGPPSSARSGARTSDGGKPLTGPAKENDLISILTTFDSPKAHFEYGQKVAAQIPKTIRAAWIASGDLSHRLKEDGPYGLHPSGPKFDQTLVDLLKNNNVEGILNLDPTLIEEAGECGLRSICMLLGALSEIDYEPKVLSYEGPFGVGYIVVNMQIV